jgi:hypothetical protein
MDTIFLDKNVLLVNHHVPSVSTLLQNVMGNVLETKANFGPELMSLKVAIAQLDIMMMENLTTVRNVPTDV